MRVLLDPPIDGGGVLAINSLLRIPAATFTRLSFKDFIEKKTVPSNYLTPKAAGKVLVRRLDLLILCAAT